MAIIVLVVCASTSLLLISSVGGLRKLHWIQLAIVVLPLDIFSLAQYGGNWKIPATFMALNTALIGGYVVSRRIGRGQVSVAGESLPGLSRRPAAPLLVVVAAFFSIYHFSKVG